MRFLRRLFGKKESPLSAQDEFALAVIAAVAESDSAFQLEYDSRAFELYHSDPDSGGQKVFLHNSFVEYQRLEESERPTHIARVAHFVIETRDAQPSGDAALENLFPVLRARADLLAETSDLDGFRYDRSSRPFCDNMLLMLAVDTDVAIGLMSDKLIDELGVSFEDALGIAIAHLWERGEHTFDKLAEGTFVSSCGDYYDASRIVLPGIFEQIPVKGNPVAIVQARSVVLVTGSDDLDGLAMIAEIALQEFPDCERAISMTAIELVNGQWRLFEVQDYHPQAVKNLKSHQAAWSYGATQKALQAKLGDDIFVATARLFQNDGRLATSAVWTDGVATAIPLVDAILIQEHNGSEAVDGFMRRMEDVFDVCGPFKQIEDLNYPIRWQVPGTIPQEQRDRLKHEYPEFKLFE